MGEYASMVYGEHWMPATENEHWRTAFEKKGGIEVIRCKGYSHHKVFTEFQVPPSPNLRSIEAIWHYPSLCYFEVHPFLVDEVPMHHLHVLVHRGLVGKGTSIRFIPAPDHGSKYPKFQGKQCGGVQLSQDITCWAPKRLSPDEIDWTICLMPMRIGKKTLPREAPEFFNAFFKKLAGSNELQEALESGMSVEEWVNSYNRELNQYKQKAYAYAIYAQLRIETYKNN